MEIIPWEYLWILVVLSHFSDLIIISNISYF